MKKRDTKILRKEFGAGSDKSNKESDWETITEHFHQRKSPMNSFERFGGRSSSPKKENEGYNSITSKSTMKQTPQAIDITALDHGARRLSWTRLMLAKEGSNPNPTPESCSELFDQNMQSFTNGSMTHKLSSIKLVSKPEPATPPPVLTRKISIKILVKNIETNDQTDIE